MPVYIFQHLNFLSIKVRVGVFVLYFYYNLFYIMNISFNSVLGNKYIRAGWLHISNFICMRMVSSSEYGQAIEM